MSRTYRNVDDSICYVNGEFYTWDEYYEVSRQEEKETGVPSFYGLTRGWNFDHKIFRKGRDKKPWNKPNKAFKQTERRKERARVGHAMVQKDYENIPRFRKTDVWNWI